MHSSFLPRFLLVYDISILLFVFKFISNFRISYVKQLQSLFERGFSISFFLHSFIHSFSFKITNLIWLVKRYFNLRTIPYKILSTSSGQESSMPIVNMSQGTLFSDEEYGVIIVSMSLSSTNSINYIWSSLNMLEIYKIEWTVTSHIERRFFY